MASCRATWCGLIRRRERHGDGGRGFGRSAAPSARPDLSVDGAIELERLEEVLYVGRPVQGQPESTVGIFKLEAGGKEAVRVPVKLGRSSVNTIEIVSGLRAGDQVIVSDMSQWDGHERVRLN